MIWGVLYIFFGLFLFVIPVIGWILGWLFIIVGFIKFIVGIVEAITPNKETQTVYIKETSIDRNEPSEDKSTMADELQKLSNLFEKGHISEDEFAQGKQKILNSHREN